jgi:hypothetical protein
MEPIPLTRRLAWSLLLLIAVVIVKSPPAQAPLLGDYASVLWAGDRVDVRRTLDRLTQAHVDTYAYLIEGGRRSATLWEALPDFLTEARAVEIKVWVYLVPPSEIPDSGGKPDYAPYGQDYRAWARAISQIAQDHPNLTALCVDDFGDNTPARNGRYGIFTADYAEQVATAARTYRPVQFWPVLFYPDLVGDTAIIDDYRDVVDGVVFPFRDAPNRNTTVSASAEAQIRAVREAANRPVVVMVYASLLSQTANGPPSPTYVEAVTRTALSLVGQDVVHGVMIYALNLTGSDDSVSFADSFDRIKTLYDSHSGSGSRRSAVPTGTPP